METMLLIAILIVCLGGMAFLYFQFRRMNSETQLESLIHKVFGMSANQIAEQSKQLLAGEKEVIQTDLTNKHRAMEQLYTQLQKSITQSQDYLQKTENDRNKMFGEMRNAIIEHKKTTETLQVSTEALHKLLQNNQQRGQWGERIIEDLLRSAGLIEGIHYLRQAPLPGLTIKPDITLLLQNKRLVPVDVKFPFTDLQKMATAESKEQKKIHLKNFGEEVKKKIVKVAEYIQPESDTLDYALMFVPNEMIFSIINQSFPDLIDEAINRRVMIVSPFSFLAVVRIVRESYHNFMMESNLREIVKQIGEFGKEWDRFIGEFDKFGDSINKLETSYRQIRDTRHKQISRQMEKIEDAKGKVKLLE